MEYLAEIYVSSGGARCGELAARLLAAADELSASGARVRCVRSIFVPLDETCFFLFEADSEAAVYEAIERANGELLRLTEAVSGAPPRDGVLAAAGRHPKGALE